MQWSISYRSYVEVGIFKTTPCACTLVIVKYISNYKNNYNTPIKHFRDHINKLNILT